jgi:ubiquinone/menaquinone biosynthesis C-methylase UbiE
MSPFIQQKQPDEKAREPARDSKTSDSSTLDLRNEIQEKYRSQSLSWSEWVYASLELLTSHPIPDDARLLELGAGTGTFWQHNAGQLPPRWKLCLTDQSMEMVRQARANLSAFPRSLRFLNVDSQALPFPKERFDMVLAIGLLDLVPDLERALQEAWRVLLPPGQFIATAGGKGHLHELEQ